MPGAMSSRLSPIISVGMPQACSTFSMPRCSSPRVSARFLPCSSVRLREISSAFSSSRALSRKSTRARSTAGVSRQAGNAFRRRLHSGVHVRRRRQRRAAEQLARRRVLHRQRIGGRRRHPGAADEVGDHSAHAVSSVGSRTAANVRSSPCRALRGRRGVSSPSPAACDRRAHHRTSASCRAARLRSAVR